MPHEWKWKFVKDERLLSIREEINFSLQPKKKNVKKVKKGVDKNEIRW